MLSVSVNITLLLIRWVGGNFRRCDTGLWHRCGDGVTSVYLSPNLSSCLC